MTTKQAFLHKTDFHKAGDGGYAVFRIPGLITTKRGTAIAWYDARKGEGCDWDPIDILMRRSTDNGLTWDEPRKLVDHAVYGADKPINNLIMIADRFTGDIHVLYCHHYERLYYMKSTDDGLTFGEPANITHVMEAYRDEYDWKVIAPGPGHGIQLHNGKLLIPVWMSTGEGGEFRTPGKKGHRPSDLAVLYSDDFGASWSAGSFVARTGEGYLHPNETVAVQLSDRRVLMNIRTEDERHRRLVSISPDGVSDWSKPVFDDALPEPICFGSILAIEGVAGHDRPPILFANPSALKHKAGLLRVSEHVSVRPYRREDLTVRASTDDCRTWSVAKLLEPGAASYSDLAQTPDGTILCLYERGQRTEGGDERRLTLARFNWNWVIEEEMD